MTQETYSEQYYKAKLETKEKWKGFWSGIAQSSLIVLCVTVGAALVFGGVYFLVGVIDDCNLTRRLETRVNFLEAKTMFIDQELEQARAGQVALWKEVNGWKPKLQLTNWCLMPTNYIYMTNLVLE